MDSESYWFCSSCQNFESSKMPNTCCHFWQFSDVPTRISTQLLIFFCFKVSIWSVLVLVESSNRNWFLCSLHWTSGSPRKPKSLFVLTIFNVQPHRSSDFTSASKVVVEETILAKKILLKNYQSFSCIWILTDHKFKSCLWYGLIAIFELINLRNNWLHFFFLVVRLKFSDLIFVGYSQ